MKLALLKKILIKELTVIVVVFAVIGGVLYFGNSYENGLKNDLAEKKGEKGKVDRAGIREKLEYEELIKAYEAYSAIAEAKLPTTQRFTNASRNRTARPILEKLKERYSFSTLDVAFPIMSSDEKTSKDGDLTIVNNKISINFKGMSDELVFSFIYSMIEEFPGYLQLQRLKMKRIQGISQKLLDTIGLKRELQPIVEGEIEFTWKTVKEPKSKKPSNEKDV